MGSGVGISVSKLAPLMSFARMTLKCVDLWLQIGTGGPFLLCVCVCVCFNHFLGGVEGGEGASPVWVKDPILLIHGSLKGS